MVLCHNRLWIEGDYPSLDRWRRKTYKGKKHPLKLSALLPPADTEDLYIWKLIYWGTPGELIFKTPEIEKSRGNEADLDYHESSVFVYYSFLSIWMPPNIWLNHAASVFPALSFTLRFAQCHDCVAGEKIWNKGEIISEKEMTPGEILRFEEMW